VGRLWATLARSDRLARRNTAALLIGVGVFLAGRLDVSEVTPQRAGAVLVPVAVAYYFLWRYAVSFLNSVVGLDVLRDDVAERIP
jgi:hypothetical protein